MTTPIPCEIQDVAYRGRGVARIEGKAVFIPRVIKGEQVKIAISRHHKRYAEAELVEVVRSSPKRTLPFCRHYEECPGCCYQHMAYDEELRTKNAQLVSLLRHVPNISQTEFSPPVPSPHDRGYRNRITLHRFQTSTQPVIGYIAHDNQSVIPIEECPLADPLINEYLKKDFFRADSSISRILLRKSNSGITAVRNNQSPSPTITEFSSVTGQLKVSANGFYQVNNELADLLFQHVSQLIESCQPDSVLDLYCGIGIFALIAGGIINGPVIGIDNDKEAIAYARENAAAHQRSHIHFKACSAADALQNLKISTGNNELWILDPPRTGLHKTTRQKILKKKPRNIIYISCAPDTLARDLQALCQTYYQIKKARLFDMFPRTYCFETVTLLSLNQ